MTTGRVLAVLFALQVPGDGSLPPATTGYGVQLVRSIAALAFVCALAWWSLRWAAKRGFGQGSGALRGRGVRVLERVPLDARRSVYLVEVGARTFLLGASEQSLTLLAELSPDDLARARAESPPNASAVSPLRFSDVLARLRGAPPPSPPPPPPPPEREG